MNHPPDRIRRIAIVGTGRFARALVRSMPGRICLVVGRSLDDAREVAALAVNADAAREPGASSVDVIWLTTSDHALADVASKIASQRPSWASTVAVHSSGAMPLSVLDPFADRQGTTIALHPNGSFTGAQAIAPGIYWSVAANIEAPEQLANELLAGLEPRLVRIDERYRALYHAAASVAANYTVTLYSMAVGLYESAGIDPDVARDIVGRFMHEAVDGAMGKGAAAAMTGPVVRGDRDVVVRQADAVGVAQPEMLEAFESLALLSARLFAPQLLQELQTAVSEGRRSSQQE